MEKILSNYPTFNRCSFFCLFLIESNIAINTFEYIALCTVIFITLEQIPKNRIAGLKVICVLLSISLNVAILLSKNHVRNSQIYPQHMTVQIFLLSHYIDLTAIFKFCHPCEQSSLSYYFSVNFSAY